MFIRTSDKETGQMMLINMDHIESVVEAGDNEDFWTELRIHGQNDSCYRVLEGVESIEGLMELALEARNDGIMQRELCHER